MAAPTGVTTYTLIKPDGVIFADPVSGVLFDTLYVGDLILISVTSGAQFFAFQVLNGGQTFNVNVPSDWVTTVTLIS